MYFLPFTIIFLILFSIFSSSHLHTIKELSLISAISAESMREKNCALEQAMQKKATADFRNAVPKTAQPVDVEDDKPEEDDLSDTYRSCKLDIVSFVADNDNTKNDSTKKLLHNLILALYGNKPFFETAKQNLSHLEEDIIEDLIKGAKELEKEKLFKSPKDLCNIEARDAPHKEVLFLMLQGNAPKKGIATAANYPSLLTFLSLSRTRHTIASLWLARPSLLLALFGNQATVDEVLKTRASIYDKLKRDTKVDPVTFEGELKTAFERSLASGIDHSFIDFRASRNDPGKYDRDM